MHEINFADQRFEGLKLSADWIRDLERSDSRLHKEAVIEKALMAAKLGSAGAQSFLYNCYQAYNPYYVFGVKQIPETQGIEYAANPWPKFWALLESLRTRSITGNRARASIAELSEQFDSLEWNTVCRRVLIKDLRCGISEKTLNKVLGNTDWAIPVFTCQLAQDSAGRPQKLIGQQRLEVKLDGVRILAVVQNGVANLYSRNGKPMENFPKIQQAIEENYRLFADKFTDRFVLDGEVVGENFQKLMKQAHRKSNVQTDGMIYHVFDIVPLVDFQRGFWNKQQRRRIELLARARNSLNSSCCIQVMPGIEVNLDTAEGHDIMDRFALASIDQGYEGIMIKDVEAPYECKRSDFWMKWKPNITVDLNIVDVEEGTGRNAGRLGAIVCEGVDNNRKIRVNVGSGFTDADRNSYWASRGNLIGQVVEVRADAVTQNQDGSYSLRFPRFERFRSFVPGEKI